MNLWHVFRFEIGHQLRRRSVWLYVGVYLAFVFYVIRQVTLGQGSDVLAGGPAQILECLSIASLFGLAVTAALTGDAAARDVRTGMEPLLYTAPVGKGALLGGRFLAVLALSVGLAVAATVVVALAVYASELPPERLGPFRTAAYVRPLAFVALPNAFIGAVLLYVAALLGRRAVASYVVGAVLFVGAQFHLSVTSDALGRYALAAGLDPMGVVAMAIHYRSLSPLEKDTLPVPFDGWIATNRLLWLGVAVLVGGLGTLLFRRAHHASTGGLLRRRRPVPDAVAVSERRSDAPVTMPAVPRAFGSAVWAWQTAAVAGRAFRQLVGGWGWVPLAGIALLQLLVGLQQMEHLDVPLVPTTARVVAVLSGEAFPYFIAALLIVYAGELVWGDREAGQAALVDAAPVPDGALLWGRLLGLALVVAVVQGLTMGVGLVVQAAFGDADVEPSLYLGTLYGLQFIAYALVAVLAFAVHVLVDHKIVGHLVALLLYAFTLGAAYLGVEHHLLVYGAAPGWTYAELSGFGTSLRPFLLFKLYWTGWALLLVAAAWLYRVRGAAHGLRDRHRAAWRGATRATARLAVAGAAVVLLAGGFVFANTNVLNTYHTSGEAAARSARYERLYGSYEGAAQPHMTAAQLRVELYPEQREATVRGTYRLVNATGRAVDTLHVATSSEVETGRVTFDRPAEAVHVDGDLGHRIYRLARALPPGDTLQMRFDVRYAPRGFTNDGAASQVAERATFFKTEAWLPQIGFQPGRLLTGAQARTDHGLRPRPAAPPLGDESARVDRHAQSVVDLDVTVGTAGDQTPVAPGEPVRTWTENGRNYVRYVADGPVRADVPVLSARYAVHEARWENPAGPDVRIQVFYQPGRDENVARFARAAQASLATLSERLGPYPHRTLKIVAEPHPRLGASAFPGLITLGDGLADLRPDRDDRDVDFAFAVMAHEVAHQWWGHQLIPALVEGAPLLTESLAWTSAMDVIEATFGPEHFERFMGVMRQAYLAPRPESGVPLLRAVESFDAYRRGPFAMHAMRSTIGAERVNAALRRLLERHGPGETPLATSLDLYRELQAAAPDSLRPLLADLFERNTYWDLETTEATAQPTGGGAWRVTLDVRARKVAVDSAGAVTTRPLDEPVEVGVFAADGAELYRQWHRVRSGEQTIRVTVPGRPARAGIDPRHLLIDTDTEDNDVDIQASASARASGPRTGDEVLP